MIECENAKAIVVQQQLNYNLSPFLLLELHYEKWAHLQPLTLTASGSPFYFDRIGEKITTTKTPQYSGNIVVIGANTSTRDFSEIGKTVIFFEGTQEKRAKVILATHRPFKRESGNNTVITGRVLL